MTAFLEFDFIAMKYIKSLLVFFFITIINLVTAQTKNNLSNDLLKKLSELPITEKVFLQFDKPLYAAGDTIYFKGYVTMGDSHKLTNISRILHVDLINTTNRIERSIKLQLVDGVAWGDFALADSLHKGIYRVRAYTQWMRNEDNYFEQNLPVGSIFGQNNYSDMGNARTVSKPDLQFFSEGGELVAGVVSKVAFKAIGTNGLGIDVGGTVLDNNGQIVTRFNSTHLGMGCFTFKPEEGKSYKATVRFGNGVENVVDLPVIKQNGLSLSVNNDSIPKATVSIRSNDIFFKENKNKNFYLLIYSAGKVTTVNFKLDSNLISFDVLKRRLSTGITRITLFSEDNEPLNERLIFVQNYDQLKLDITTNKKNYTTREKVNIKVNAATRAGLASVGHFSVSVIDENKVNIDEDATNTILTHLLLASDLTGYIEKPNYYFLNINQKTAADLDLVMLTHGYRRFEWKKNLNSVFQPDKWQPEDGLQINGVAKSLGGRPLNNGNVSLLAMKSNGFLTKKTDSTGHFSFRNLAFFDSTQFIIQAANSRGKNLTKIVYQDEVPAPIVKKLEIFSDIGDPSMTDYLKNKEKEQEEMSRLGLGHGRVLKEVVIKSKKFDNNYRTSSLAGAGFADQVMHSKQIQEIQGPLATSLNGRLHNITFLTINGKAIATYMQRQMLIIIDGVEDNDVNRLNANDVETVEVLRSGNSSIYGMSGGNGVIIITTKRGAGVDPTDIPSYGVLPINVLGYYKPRAFYSPKYNAASINSLADLRSTIFWNPEVVTDKDGNATFDYFNAGSPGTYRFEIEGVDENGVLGQQVYRYKVE